MKFYQDTEGSVIRAYSVDGPIILNTIHGEKCGEPGCYVIVMQDNKTAILSEQDFAVSFTEIEGV